MQSFQENAPARPSRETDRKSDVIRFDENDRMARRPALDLQAFHAEFFPQLDRLLLGQAAQLRKVFFVHVKINRKHPDGLL